MTLAAWAACVGVLLGPALANVLRPDLAQHLRLLETMAEIALLVSLFAAGLALHRVLEQPRAGSRPLKPAADAAGHSYETLATHSHHASATMLDSVRLLCGRCRRRFLFPARGCGAYKPS